MRGKAIGSQASGETGGIGVALGRAGNGRSEWKASSAQAKRASGGAHRKRVAAWRLENNIWRSQAA